MALKGDLKLEIDEQGIEVRITITPDENGADISTESLMAILAEKKVKSGIDTGAIDRAFRGLARKKTDPVTFVAAAGVPPSHRRRRASSSSRSRCPRGWPQSRARSSPRRKRPGDSACGKRGSAARRRC